MHFFLFSISILSHGIRYRHMNTGCNRRSAATDRTNRCTRVYLRDFGFPFFSHHPNPCSQSFCATVRHNSCRRYCLFAPALSCHRKHRSPETTKPAGTEPFLLFPCSGETERRRMCSFKSPILLSPNRSDLRQQLSPFEAEQRANVFIFGEKGLLSFIQKVLCSFSPGPGVRTCKVKLYVF